MKKIYIIKIMFLFFISRSLASELEAVTNWGPLQCEAKCAITLTTNILYAGQTNVLNCWIANTSTNLIFATETNPNHNIEVLIENGLGKQFALTPKPNTNVFYYRTSTIIQPGELVNYSIPINVGTNIDKAHYVFFVRREILLNKVKCELISNKLNVEIK